MELFNNQKFEKLRKHQVDIGLPWTDPTFSASDGSIGLSAIRTLPSKIHWKRPNEITDDPRLCVDGICPKDVTQGRLGNCWFVAACSVLAGSQEVWKKVVPDHVEQEFSSQISQYSGVFRFRFWRFGKWVEVLVDDLLPTFTSDGDEAELLFAHSSSKREFWCCLLEKAYAKLHGSYAVLDGGNLSDALVDFTSGVSELIDLTKASNQRDADQKTALFNTITGELEDHALMCAAIAANGAEEMEQRTELGLVKGHAYGITATRKIPIGETTLKSLFKGREKLPLVRLQNPWGKREWRGSFGDGSPEWTNISDREKEKLGLTFDDDGEFWMPFDDFLTHFSEMSICRVINTSLFTYAKTWKELQLFGSWAVGKPDKGPKADRAGGCLNHRETFLNNPQYRFDVPRVGEDPSKGQQEIIVQLSQSDARSAGLPTDKQENKTIGFHVMKVEDNRKFRVHQLMADSSVATSDYVRTKHIFLRASMPRSGGRFVIVPTTFNPGEATQFLLRMFAEQKADVEELVDDRPAIPWYRSCCTDEFCLVTRLTVVGVTGLENKDRFGKCNPYCYVKCEGEAAKSFAAKDSLSPTFNFSCVFYRAKPSTPIKIQIWDRNLVVDRFLGQAFLLATPNPDGKQNAPKVENLTLVGRKGKRAERLPGEMKVYVESYEDLDGI